MNKQVQDVSILKTFPNITFCANLEQSKSTRTGPNIPIRLSHQKRVPRYYSSKFTLTVLYGGNPLAERFSDGTMSLFSAFTPVVCANNNEVLWYDFSADFALSLTELINRLTQTFPNGAVQSQ